MKRVLFCIFSLWIVIASLMSAVRVYGVAHPLAHELTTLGFDLCDGSPCFMGITPGITGWNEGKAILTPKYGAYNTLEDPASAHHQWVLPVNNGYIQVDSANAKVDAIWSRVTLTETLGEVIQQFGLPCGVTIYSSINVAFISYGNAVISVALAKVGDKLSPSLPVSGIAIVDPRLNPRSVTCGSNNTFGDAVWLGFTSSQKYVLHNTRPFIPNY